MSLSTLIKKILFFFYFSVIGVCVWSDEITINKNIAHFQVLVCLRVSKLVFVRNYSYENLFHHRPACPFSCKSNSFSYEIFCMKTRFDTEANQNSEMGYCFYIFIFEKPCVVVLGKFDCVRCSSVIWKLWLFLVVREPYICSMCCTVWMPDRAKRSLWFISRWVYFCHH